jgi:DNA-binding transcriptional regulator LsrR (DeoR family)
VTDVAAPFLTSVARMYYLDGLGQSEIAHIHGISRSTVSRMLTAAREQGIVRISVDAYEPRDRALEARLQDRFGLTRAVVVRSIGKTAARRTVGYYAAPEVASWIASARTVGISGGRTLEALVAGMEPRPHEDGLRIVQLMGTIGSTPGAIDASELARTLASRFQATWYAVNAPAFVEDARMRDLFLSHPQLTSVWGLFPAIDLALVGIGTLEESAFLERRVLRKEDYAELRIYGAVGELCGHFFDREGRECPSPFRDRVVSVELETLRSHADVVAVTAGAARREALLAALRGELVTSLVIDDAGAAALLS